MYVSDQELRCRLATSVNAASIAASSTWVYSSAVVEMCWWPRTSFATVNTRDLHQMLGHGGPEHVRGGVHAEPCGGGP